MDEKNALIEAFNGKTVSEEEFAGTRSNTELIIAKHRDGPTKPVHLYFVEPFSDFRENLYYLGQENDSDEELPF